MRNSSDKSCRENQNSHFMCSKFFFENNAVYEIMWKKSFRAGQATDDRCTWGYRQTLRICNSYCFFIHYNNCYTNAPHCYVIRTLPVLSYPKEFSGQSKTLFRTEVLILGALSVKKKSDIFCDLQSVNFAKYLTHHVQSDCLQFMCTPVTVPSCFSLSPLWTALLLFFSFRNAAFICQETWHVFNYLLIASGADRCPQIVSLLLAQPIAISRERLVRLFLIIFG